MGIITNCRVCGKDTSRLMCNGICINKEYGSEDVCSSCCRAVYKFLERNVEPTRKSEGTIYKCDMCETKINKSFEIYFLLTPGINGFLNINDNGKRYYLCKKCNTLVMNKFFKQSEE